MAAETLELPNDPAASAKAVGLRYVTDESPGFRRERAGQGFRFRHPNGKLLRDSETLGRIKSLAIPPAWTDVWICPEANGHLQATGRDARGRKQHRYHPRWREVRDETKYNRMIVFAKALPKIRARVKEDLALSGLPRRKVLATVVRLLELSLIRIGNDEYARENDSFGLTTMQDRHVDVNGSELRFSFHGKGGKRHNVDLNDPKLARIVEHCQELPGQDLFQFIDDDGAVEDVKSGDVNDYLREISGEDFTAKDFRTWAGTVLAALALRELAQFHTRAQAKKNVIKAIESVAQRLGNTPAICRKCYVHPHVLDSYADGTLMKSLKRRAEKELTESIHRLKPEEAAVLGLLQQRLTLEERLAASLKKETAARKKRSQKK